MAFYSQEYDLFLHATKSFCHSCHNLSQLIDAHVVTKNNEVFLRKFCPECGTTLVKISTDLDYFRLCDEYLKQPDLPETSITKVKKGCPFDCGVCPQHQNHPCLGLFNITSECNMRCNICYFSSFPGSGKHRSIKEIEAMLMMLLATESEPDLIQITGGEPTVHPQICEILLLVKKSPVRHLMLNTNGIRIAEDEGFVRFLRDLGRGFEVYLQFDSMNSETLLDIRGQDMSAVRKQALLMLEKYNISTTLVSVIKKGLNDKEIPEIIEFSRKWRCVRGIVFQPVSHVGRVKETDDSHHITLSEIRQLVIDDQSNPFDANDMIPLPCDPHKISVGYAAKKFSTEGEEPPMAKLFSVTGKIPKEAITQQKGTIAFEHDSNFVKTVIETVSLDTAMGEAIVKNKIKRKLFCCWPTFLSPQNMDYDNVYRIVIMEFTDCYNFDSTNIKRECNFMIEPHGIIPFSTYNMGIKFSQ